MQSIKGTESETIIASELKIKQIKETTEKRKKISLHAGNRKFHSTHKSKLPKNGEIYIDSMTLIKVT